MSSAGLDGIDQIRYFNSEYVEKEWKKKTKPTFVFIEIGFYVNARIAWTMKRSRGLRPISIYW